MLYIEKNNTKKKAVDRQPFEYKNNLCYSYFTILTVPSVPAMLTFTM